MTSGSSPKTVGRIGLVFAFLISSVTASSADSQTPNPTAWSLPDLMQALQRVKFASAHFVERKYVGMLTRPLQASGTLRYIAPDRLEKVTIFPTQEIVRLDGDNLSGSRGELSGSRRIESDRYSVSLSDHQEIAAVVEGIRSTLAGDLPTLQRYYDVSLKGQPSNWQLSMIPKNEAVQALVSEIAIAGSGTMLKSVAMREKDGDRSEMTIDQDPR